MTEPAGHGAAPVFVTGASGLVGSLLCEMLLDAGERVVALTRRSVLPGGQRGLETVGGDVTEPGDWQRALGECRAVVHLAGEPIAEGRWNAARKQQLRESRVLGTRNVVQAIAFAQQPPSAFVCASATGYYGRRGHETLDESATPGDDFLAGLCVDWEAEALRAADHGTRAVCLRFGMVLSRRGGALPRMLTPFRLGLGAPLGPADRYTPWVHEADAAGLARFALESSALAGPVNAVAPETVRMGELTRALAAALGRPAFLPAVPEAALRVLLGEAADAVVPGQRVRPRAATEAGYRFAHPTLRGAFADLLT